MSFCVFCGKTMAGNFPRHLREYHNLSDRALVLYAKDIKNLGKNPQTYHQLPFIVGKTIRYRCPVGGCTAVVKQLGPHLQTVKHKMKRGSKKYQKFMNKAKDPAYIIRSEGTADQEQPENPQAGSNSSAQ